MPGGYYLTKEEFRELSEYAERLSAQPSYKHSQTRVERDMAFGRRMETLLDRVESRATQS